MKNLLFLTLAALLSLGALTACSDDSENAQDIQCADDELYNPRTEECVQIDSDADAGNNTDLTDTDEQLDDTDIADDASQPEDAEEDTDTPDVIDPTCDKDNDGHLSLECGGDDCDDNDPARFPGQFEICNGIDDNCNGIADEFIECSFYAHTNDGLYKINPFEKSLDKESDLVDEDGDPVKLLDIDTHPSGTLYGVTRTAIYIFYPTENYWIQVARITFSSTIDPNGLAIDFDGNAFITSESDVYKVDLSPIEDRIETRGLLPGTFNNLVSISSQKLSVSPSYFKSSGDSVVNKQNTLYMTSKHDFEEDHLVEINRDTAEAVEIGGIGFDRVFGLTSAWNNLYGTTTEGELITIDLATGKGTLVHTFPGKRWYGAASSPAR